ncbi:polyprenyl synthetase family protein [Pedomonas mirosovicensis]|uniref:polyprenyl synthetase family protein n=1 Tax=Pedomonas mirosovicensis TaxID=2908641 RepID=UPI00216994EA|nr:polyprenyl synthetase family protein [Pedomonas mirosovicensis]MCH8685520.1 polyprenyl synthetase family protein [Pedomonas mirosovicensis]
MTASIQPLRAEYAKAPSIDRLLALVGQDLEAVNQIIIERMQSPVAMIPELAGHLIASGGKRLRPMLLLASAKLLGYEGTRHHKLAASVEFIHTATLLHDDVVDGSNLRRGRKTANIIWGNQPSVLVGDFLFGRSFELMVEDGSLRVLRILSQVAAIMAQGEVDQLTTARDVETTEERYLDVITAKTAVLFAASCQVAAAIMEKDEATESALEAYGRYLGIAFQLVDDALDYASDSDVMGKAVGDDFREGKVTLPTILAYQRGSEEEREFWRRTIGRLKQEPEDLTRAIATMNRHGAIRDTLARARQYGDMAKEALAALPDGEAKDCLIETVDFAIARAF